MAMRKTQPPEYRFWNKVNRESSEQCWPWTGATNGRYGILGAGRRGQSPVYAHRVSYKIAFGEIPEEMQVLHKCDNQICVNPKHLFLGTQVDNMRDCVAKKRHKSGYAIWKKRNQCGEQNWPEKTTP